MAVDRMAKKSTAWGRKSIMMNVDDALDIVEFVLDEDSNFTDIQQIIFRECWQGRCSYQEIEKVYGYEYEYIKSTAAQLWRCLSVAFGEKVKKGNLRSVINRYLRRQYITFNRNVFEINSTSSAAYNGQSQFCHSYTDTDKLSTVKKEENKSEITATPGSENNHNNLQFSKLSQSLLQEAEAKIAEALDSIGVTFFMKPNIRLTAPEGKCNLQPSFVIYYGGKLGIIEIDETEKGFNNGVGGEVGKNSDRLLQNTNIDIIKHYDDFRCFLEPNLVIKEFMEILSSIDSHSDVDRNLLE